MRTSKWIGLALAAGLSAGSYALTWQTAGAADDDGGAVTKNSSPTSSKTKVKAGEDDSTADEAINPDDPPAQEVRVRSDLPPETNDEETISKTVTNSTNADKKANAAGQTTLPPADKGASETDPADLAVMGAPISAQGNTALQHYDMARHYFSQWQLSLAEVEFEVTIMYGPNMKIAHRDYSLVSLLRGHPIRAFAEALMTVGVCEPIPFNTDEQKDLMQRASKAHYQRALVYAKKAEWNNAIAELDIAGNYTPDKPSVMRSLAFCYASEGDFKRSEEQYNKVFAVDPDDAFSHADFAYMLSEHGQSDRAEKQLRHAVAIAPQVAALHVDLGWLAERQGDFHKAQSEFEQAIKLCPKQPGLWLQLGKVLERAGKSEEAKNAYNEVLAIDSSEDEARERLQALKSPGSTLLDSKLKSAKHPS